MKTIKLTEAELNHLVRLIACNEIDGTYFSNRRQYWKRSFEIKQKLLSPAPVDFYCPCCGRKHNNMAFIGFCSEGCLNKH
jgi:hypothetical protein